MARSRRQRCPGRALAGLPGAAQPAPASSPPHLRRLQGSAVQRQGAFGVLKLLLRLRWVKAGGSIVCGVCGGMPVVTSDWMLIDFVYS